MTIDHYRTDMGEWVVGASVYTSSRRFRRQWVINLELGFWVVTIYLGGAQ